MYYLPQYGKLEHIVGNTSGYTGYSSSQPFYSITASFQPSYHDQTFVPFQHSNHSSLSFSEERMVPYSTQQEKYALLTIQPEYHFVPESFLRPGKEGIFVGKAEEVREFVEETFETIFQQPFPNHIKISILNQEEFRKIAPSPNTIGLSLNRSQENLLSEIFILNDSLGRVMLTIGHELGHVLTKTLPNPHDEEAKAYAFSLLWMKVIKEHNVANLSSVIVLENPAHNGVHNIGFSLVERLLNLGTTEKEIYVGILQGLFSAQHRMLA